MVFLTFSPTFVILTISYEGLFYFVFCMTVVTWVRLEHAIYVYNKPAASTQPATPEQKEADESRPEPPSGPPAKTTVSGETFAYRALTISDARVALFFFYLLQSAFFSTGNIASVSSFSLDSVYRLIPIFNPFSQGALLILKLLIPFTVISANLGILNRRLEMAPSALFMVVMTISDVMTLNFFYMVRDEGSWLEIGTTISHFFIASCLCILVAGLEFASELFVSGVDFGTAQAEASAVLDEAKAAISKAVNNVEANNNNDLNGSAGKKHAGPQLEDSGKSTGSAPLPNGVEAVSAPVPVPS